MLATNALSNCRKCGVFFPALPPSLCDCILALCLLFRDSRPANLEALLGTASRSLPAPPPLSPCPWEKLPYECRSFPAPGLERPWEKTGSQAAVPVLAEDHPRHASFPGHRLSTSHNRSSSVLGLRRGGRRGCRCRDLSWEEAVGPPATWDPALVPPH